MRVGLVDLDDQVVAALPESGGVGDAQGLAATLVDNLIGVGGMHAVDFHFLAVQQSILPPYLLHFTPLP